MSIQNVQFDVLVIDLEDYIEVFYTFDFILQGKRYENSQLREMFKIVKAMCKADYGYNNGTRGSGVSIKVPKDQAKPQHLAVMADSYELSYAKQHPED